MESINSMSIFELATSRSGLVANVKDKSQTESKDSSAFAFLLDDVSKKAAQGTVASAPNPAANSPGFLNQLWTNSDGRVSEPVNRPMPPSATKSVAFVNSILHPSQLAADKLGTTTAAVIAVAAHETGWGKHIINKVGENSSHNLFGIKADQSSEKAVVMANTNEYINGVKTTLAQPFRTYASKAASVNDFVDFLQSNPRYSKALSNASDPQRFIESIHSAGYATDPDYASKVKSVMAQVETILQAQGHQSVRLAL